jgi:hypothetical protein
MLWVNPNFEFLNWQFLTRRHEDRFYPINSKLSNSQCALAHNSSLGSAACLSKNSKFLIPNSDGVRYANIVQAVKTCYKIKIGFRDFASRFSAVLLRL